MLTGDAVLLCVAAAVLLFAALHDIAFRSLPDWVSLVLAADGCLVRVLQHSLPAGLACGLGMFAAAWICWRLGWLGGGDVKLLGATSILVPPDFVFGYIAAVALAGGGLGLLYLLLEQLVPALPLRHRASLAWRVLVVECRRIRRRTSLPYATAISFAALLVLVKD